MHRTHPKLAWLQLNFFQLIVELTRQLPNQNKHFAFLVSIWLISKATAKILKKLTYFRLNNWETIISFEIELRLLSLTAWWNVMTLALAMNCQKRDITSIRGGDAKKTCFHDFGHEYLPVQKLNHHIHQIAVGERKIKRKTRGMKGKASRWLVELWLPNLIQDWNCGKIWKCRYSYLFKPPLAAWVGGIMVVDFFAMLRNCSRGIHHSSVRLLENYAIVKTSNWTSFLHFPKLTLIVSTFAYLDLDLVFVCCRKPSDKCFKSKKSA